VQDEEQDIGGPYFSPPCFMQELSPEFRTEMVRSDAWTAVSGWRKAERSRLLAERMALTPDDRQVRSGRIACQLDIVIGKVAGRIVGTYWPIRGEPDLRNWGLRVTEQGGRLALPVVIRKGWPLEYRIWMPGDPLERGVWNILVPASGPAVQPDVVIAPVVGFDGAHYRLGYGGGYFDRTLAAFESKPLTIGVGYAQSRLRTIYPQLHDIPMDVVITD
jgi:5-formyltetrahydrofolate cyclo-ligase